MKSYYIFFLGIFLFFSCSNDDDQSGTRQGSLIFGTFAGECFGDCFDVFRIDNGKLQEDQVVDFFTQDYSFTSSFTFPELQFNLYKNILSEIPQELVDGSDKTYGCPDCADQGGFYFEIRTSDGATKKYIVDTNNTTDQSEEILVFKNKISEIIKNLRGVN